VHLDNPIVLLNLAIIMVGTWHAAKTVKNGWWLFLAVPAICGAAIGATLALNVMLELEATDKAIETAKVDFFVALFIGPLWAALTRWRKWAAEARYRRSPARDPRADWL
jgi:hypothetical protein